MIQDICQLAYFFNLATRLKNTEKLYSIFWTLKGLSSNLNDANNLLVEVEKYILQLIGTMLCGFPDDVS